MRIVTWNVWARFGDDPQSRQEPIARTLEALDADVICLQETYVTEDGDDQAARLARRLGMNHQSVDIELNRNRWGMGNAILARGEIGEFAEHSLAVGDQAKRRTALAAKVGHKQHKVSVICTHLDHHFAHSALRETQVRRLCGLVRDLRDPNGYPVILAGDLNSVASSDEIRLLTGERPPPVADLIMNDAWPQRSVEPGFTWCATNPHLAQAMYPNRRIDYVFIECPRNVPLGNVQQVQLAGNEPVDGVTPSDHYAVVVDLVD